MGKLRTRPLQGLEGLQRLEGLQGQAHSSLRPAAKLRHRPITHYFPIHPPFGNSSLAI